MGNNNKIIMSEKKDISNGVAKKGLRRKLIGFMAGEKGSIGKLQALGLGIAGIIGSGLLIPKEVEGWANIDDWGNAAWSNSAYNYTSEWGADSSPDPCPPDWGNSTVWGDAEWSGDSPWSDWQNAPPSVKIEVK